MQHGDAVNIIVNPCPFCGGEAELFRTGNIWPEEYFRILCKKACCVQGKFYKTPEKSAEAWNSRYAIPVNVTFG